jgi:KaiC/GvpD/RAD55 family RecA-like ATPase
MVPSTRHYSTGLPFLDRRIDGRLPAGSLLAIVAPSHSQSELLLKQLVQTRRTRFVSTHRPPDEVERWVESSPTSVDDLTVTQLDVSTLLEEFPEPVDPIPDESFVVLAALLILVGRFFHVRDERVRLRRYHQHPRAKRAVHRARTV